MDSSRSVSIQSRRQLLRGFAGLAASTFLSGCGADLYRTVASTATGAQPMPSRPSTGANLPSVQPVPVGPISAASMVVTATSIGTLADDFLGLAFEKRSLPTNLFSASTTQLVNLLKLLGPGVLRIGGASVDEAVWAQDGAGQTAGQIAPADIAALATFLQAIGWSCIYGVNLGGSANGSTTAAMAAAEVACVSQLLGSALVGIELGNECENYGDAGSFYAYDWTIEKFEALWFSFRDAIVAATSSAPLVGPAAASQIDTWTIPFGEYVTKSKINLVTQHYFPVDAGSNPTVNDLIAPDSVLSSSLLQLTYGSESMDVPFRIAECSSTSGGGVSGVSNAYASTLWAVDMIFNSAIGGASGVNFQAGGQTASSLITESQGTMLGAQPGFYGLLLAARAGAGSMLATQIAVASLNVSGYAIQNAAGGLSLVIVNKDQTQNLDLSVSVPATMRTGTLSVLSQLSQGAVGPSLSALSGISLQGASIAADGSFSPADTYPVLPNGRQISCYVPALCAVLIQLA